MKLLIVAATQAEIAPFLGHLQELSPKKTQLDILITGVGMVATTYALGRHLHSRRYDLVIQAGVCGSFDSNISLGDVVFVSSDQFADLGAEDHENYIDIFGLGLLEAESYPFTGGKLVNPQLHAHRNISLPKVSGITANTVSGSERTIAFRSKKYGCQVESMEGAAFHYVCLQEKVPFAQIRAVSNYVIPRDKSQWKMKEAIISLNNWLIDYIDHQ